jgi:chromosome segregation ATPase
MKAILCLGVVAFLASCDNSKQELATTQATLSDVTKERDDLKSKVASLQQELDTTKSDLSKEKAEKTEKMPSNTMAATKAPDTKGAAADAKAAAKGKHGHKS